MREYLFRGKRKGDKEWQFGHLHIIEWDKPAKVKGDYIDYRILGRHNECSYVDPETVGQDTGMKDKNGKTIFEGYIVLFGETPLVVYWNGEAFGWCAKAEQYPFRRFPSCRDWDYIDLGWIAAEAPCTGEITTEIIGNIHDNPELLKEGGEE